MCMLWLWAAGAQGPDNAADKHISKASGADTHCLDVHIGILYTV